MPTSSPYRLYIWIGMVLIAFLAAIKIGLPFWTASPPELMRLKQIPDFSLTERSGRTITRDNLAGKICVVSFFFSSCPGPCPIISNNMEKIQSVFQNDDRVQLVSISIDPEDDTPPVLTKYAHHYQADPEHWWFLTGEEKAVYTLVHDGFLQLVTDNRGQKLDEGQYLFTHSTRLALLDGSGFIRGYFDGTTAEGRFAAVAGVRQLERESR